jgi:hypothetical protein
MRAGYYNPQQRMREKQISRDEDDRALRSGAVSRDEMSRRNGLVSSLDLSRASISSRGRVSS